MDWTELSGKLNSKFDWERQIQDVIGMDISIAQVDHLIAVIIKPVLMYGGFLSGGINSENCVILLCNSVNQASVVPDTLVL